MEAVADHLLGWFGKLITLGKLDPKQIQAPLKVHKGTMRALTGGPAKLAGYQSQAWRGADRCGLWTSAHADVSPRLR